MKVEMKLTVGTGLMLLTLSLSAGLAQWRLARTMRLSLASSSNGGTYSAELQHVRKDFAEKTIMLESSILEVPNIPAARNLSNSGGEGYERLQTDVAELQHLVDQADEGPVKHRLSEVLFQFRKIAQLNPVIAKLAAEGGAGRQQAQTMLVQEVLPLLFGVEETSESILQTKMALRENAIERLGEIDRMAVACLWAAVILNALFITYRHVLSARRLKAISLIANRAAAIASGDLTGQDLNISVTDQIGALAEGMQSMQMELASVIGTVASTAGTLSSSAVSMRSASDQMHRRIDQQAQQTQQAATAMQEMSASIAEVSRHTQSAAETARCAAQTARDGGTIVKQMLGSMHSIASAVTETSSTVGLLGEDSKRISQIVTVINEIARKTNLLALNAAIEAARAGDQGRGFAVVAGEVRRLAESTAQATGEIASMIQGIQDRTRTAIASMASGTGTVQEGVVTTNKAGEALERIIGMAERVDRMITQIAIAASQQATAADQSSASLDSIHSLSNENLAEMSTTKAGIDSLRGTVVRLEKQVDRFQVAVA